MSRQTTPEMTPGMTPALKEELIQWLHQKTKFWSETAKNKQINGREYEYALGCMFAFGAVLDQLSTLGNRRTDPVPMLCFQHGGSEACEAENKKNGFTCPKCENQVNQDIIRFEWLMQHVNAPRDVIDKHMLYPEEQERVEKAIRRAKLLRLFEFISEGQQEVTAEELKAVRDSWERKEQT